MKKHILAIGSTETCLCGIQVSPLRPSARTESTATACRGKVNNVFSGRAGTVSTLIYLVAFCCVVLFAPSVSSGSPHDEEYRRIQEKMQEQKKKLNEAQEKESSILTELEEVSMKLGKIETELTRVKKNLYHTEAEIADVSADIQKTRANIDRRKEWMKRKLKSMQRLGGYGDLMPVLLNAKDPAQMMRTWRYMEAVAKSEAEMMNRYRESLAVLEAKAARLRALKAEFKENTEKVRKKEAELADSRKTKENILASVRKEKASHQKMLTELKEASKKLQDLIRESSKTDTYSAGGGGFLKQKGRLPWPAEGKIAVPYGAQKDPQFNTPVFRNGVQIQTDNNSEARSVYEGKVIFAEWFKGFGQLVIINHGNGYHSLYGNLSEIFSRVGDIIKDSQVLGRVGTSGVLNAPGLYFEIRYKGKPLDPVQWLRVKRR